MKTSNKTGLPTISVHGAPQAEDRQFVTALARGLEVLRCFSAARPELGSREIAALIGLPQPTVWRLCYTLSHLGYLVPGVNPGKLRVGAASLALGAASLDALQFTEVIRPHLRRFIADFPAAVILAQQHQFSMVYLLRCDGDTTFVMKLPVGSSVPLFDSTVGRVCLAGWTEETRAPLLRQLQQHSPDQGKLWLKKLAETQEQLKTRGFVVDDGEASAAVRMAALPLLSPDRSTAYTLLCGGPSFALPQDLLEERIGPALVALARQIAPALPCGGLPPIQLD